jgi:hypothetical protein
MADLTVGAVKGLLGLLSTAVTDEARLVGGLPANMQFIKDEMDSMNGFLLHLTKTESEHDDQIRAWMKQVREIAYIAEDCVERYVRDIAPHDGEGLLATARFLLLHPNKYYQRHRLAKKILELKVRVNDVGERRNRYGVEVPPGSDLKKAAEDAAADKEERRDAFLHALEQGIANISRPPQPQEAPRTMFPSAAAAAAAIRWLRPAVPSFITEAIGQLPAAHVKSQLGAKALVHATWKKCCPAPPLPPDDETLRCIRMLLCALYVYPYKTTNLELERLKEKLRQDDEDGGGAAEEIKKQVMIFCYSFLSIEQKSCLQYLTAFFEENAISRTSLVRRWVAEGLVGKEQGRTDEEVGESYFKDLLFRGFITPGRTSDAGTVKSCKPLAGSIRAFIKSIAASENFVNELPTHLDRQLRIRKIVGRPWQQQQHHQPPSGCCGWSWRDVVGAIDDYCCGCCCGCWRDDNPMDELVGFLKKLPELYRLNVLDLGGCRGLKPRHMEAICSVAWLKYLSLRKTDVSWLLPSHLEKLKLLETLDIRETPHLHPRDVRRMYLPKLKHLLAGRYADNVTGEDVPSAKAATSAEVSLLTVPIPAKISAMRRMETLSHVQVSGDDGTDLGRVAKLQNLRKLGVVIRRANHRGAQQLREVIYALAGCLRSLSIWVVTQHQGQGQSAGVLDISILPEATSSLVLENLDVNGRIGGTSIPLWAEKAGKLANISLRDTEMSGGETLTRLANVPSLRCLKLGRTGHSSSKRSSSGTASALKPSSSSSSTATPSPASPLPPPVQLLSSRGSFGP